MFSAGGVEFTSFNAFVQQLLQLLKTLERRCTLSNFSWQSFIPDSLRQCAGDGMGRYKKPANEPLTGLFAGPLTA